MVIDGDSTSVEEQASPGADQTSWDFSSLHGFQFVGANDGSADGDVSQDERRRAALTLELDARAARFHQAVDASIVLASDGMIRWLGDPIARLAAGDDLFAPRTILLVDPAMSEESQKSVVARLDLWLSATVQRLLGPLFALRTMQEGSQPLQDLAGKIANALGVLDREPVRNVVRNLDQTSRSVLRKHGVRFGSYYLYVPSTLRPAARALALQLSCVRKGDEAFTAAAQGLIPMASSGRTSAPPDARVNAETYRVGGFRACGDRVVRVDIVERLADMIRAASVLRVVGSDSGPAGFQVTSQMTSLTGCSGDGFASILKALGFESQTVRRSEVVWPAAAVPVTPPTAAPETAQPTGDETATGDLTTADLTTAEDGGHGRPGDGDAASASDAPDGQAEGSAPAEAEALEAAEATEPAPDHADEPEGEPSPAHADGDEPVAASEAAETAPSLLDGEAADIDAPDGEAGPDLSPPAEAEAAPEIAADDGPPAEASAAADEAPPEADATSRIAADEVAPPESADVQDLAEPTEAESAADAVVDAQPAPPAADEEMVTIWRFVRLRVAHPPRRPKPVRRTHGGAERHAQPQAIPASPGEAAPDSVQPPDAQAPRDRPAGRFERPSHEKRKHWDGDKGKRPPQDNREGRRGPDGRPGGGHSGGDRPGGGRPGDRPEGGHPGGGHPGGDRKPVVDPMSPFAKLMELRSILEAESKKRR